MAYTARIVEPILETGRYLSGEDRLAPLSDPVLTEAVRLHVIGFGVRKILKGSKLWPGHGKLSTEIREGELRKVLADWDADHPAFVAWRDRTFKQYRRDKFVTNPYGRRVYGIKDAQSFLILSTVSDCVKDRLAAVPDAVPRRFGFGFVTVTRLADARAIADCNDPLPWECK